MSKEKDNFETKETKPKDEQLDKVLKAIDSEIDEESNSLKLQMEYLLGRNCDDIIEALKKEVDEEWEEDE